MANAFGLPSLFDPTIAVDQAQLDRQTALANALRQQSFEGLNPNRQLGGMGYKISPLEVVGKLMQGYAAKQMDTANDEAKASLAQKNLTALVSMLRGDAGQPAQSAAPSQAFAGANPDYQPMPGVGGPSSPTVAGNSAPNASAGFTLANLLRSNAIGALGGEPMAAAYAKNFETPEKVRSLVAMGQNPNAVGNLETAKLQREVDQPLALGQGTLWSPKGGLQGLPQQIEGAINIPDSTVPGGWRAALVPGASEAIGAQAAAKGLGAAAATPYAGVDANGNPVPVKSVAEVLRAPGPISTRPEAQVPPAVQAQRDDGRMQILKDELSRETDPKMKAAIQTEIDAMGRKGGVFAAPPLGTESAQKGLDTSWEALKAQSREANNTKSYLQSIVSAAEKGAITGPQADRREMIAGLLQLAGIKEGVNTNATTQTQLLDKYQNQIIARLGQGGMGTDAARAILQAAYPGKHMNLDSIKEASANLVGAQEMTQAKTRLLLPYATKRDSTGYQEKEIAFDQAADPRVWQLERAKDPKAFINSLDPAVAAELLKSRQTLKALGAL